MSGILNKIPRRLGNFQNFFALQNLSRFLAIILHGSLGVVSNFTHLFEGGAKITQLFINVIISDLINSTSAERDEIGMLTLKRESIDVSSSRDSRRIASITKRDGRREGNHTDRGGSLFPRHLFKPVKRS